MFVSHSGEDTWAARQVAKAIEACGARAFPDEADIGIGGETDEELRNFLNKADELLVLLTPWALERPYIWVEVGIIWGRAKPFAVALHGIGRKELLSNPSVPTFVKAKNLISINSIDKYFDQLTQCVKRGDLDGS